MFTPLTTTVREASSELVALPAKVDDLENRSRRNNLRFVGFPEKSEEGQSGEFLLTWLKGTLGQDVTPASFAIERAYRTPPLPPLAGASPRPPIAPIPNFQDKMAILRDYEASCATIAR